MENEPELAAMRELLPAATLTLTTTPEYGSVPVTFVTLAPGNVQGVVKSDGERLVSLQARSRTADASHDLGLVAKAVLDAEPGSVIDRLDLRQKGPKLQELFGTAAGEFTHHSDFGFWLTDDERTEDAAEAIRRSADEIVPTAPVPGQRATYWTSMTHDFLRMVLADDEDAVFDGLARLRADGELQMRGEDWTADFIGAFRLVGIVAPVWEFSRRVSVDEITDEVTALRQRIDDAVAVTEALSADARRAREGLVSRQVSVR